MSTFDFNAAANLFPEYVQAFQRKALGYRRFRRASDAIRFAVEGLSASRLPRAMLEVAGLQFDHRDMLKLYAQANFPLVRRLPV